jgi:hypothetical protein
MDTKLIFNILQKLLVEGPAGLLKIINDLPKKENILPCQVIYIPTSLKQD